MKYIDGGKNIRKNVFLTQPIEYYEELGLGDFLSKNNLIFPSVVNSIFYRKVSLCDAVVSCIYHCSTSMNAARIANELGKPVIYFSDGVEDWENMINNGFLKSKGLKQHFPSYADIYFLCTQGGKGFLSHLGKRCFFYIPKRAMVSYSDNCTSEPDFDFLVTTANSAYFNDGEFYRLCEIVKEIELVAKQKNYKLCYRIFDKKLVEYLNIDDSLNFINGGFGEALLTAKCIITTPSTVAITSMNEGKPTGVIDYRNSPLMFQAGWRLHKSSNIFDTLEDMLSHNEEKINFQNSQLADQVHLKDVNEVISKMIEDNKISSSELLKNNARVLPGIEFLFRGIYKRIKHNSIVKYFVKKVRKG